MTLSLLAGRAAMLTIGLGGIAVVVFYMRNIERLARSRAYWLFGLAMIVFCGLVVPNLQATAGRAIEGRAEAGGFFIGLVFAQGILMLAVIFGAIWLRRRKRT